MLEKLDNSVFSKNMFFHNVDSNIITFISHDMDFNMGLVMIILMKNILKLLFMLDLRLGIIDLNKIKCIKKIKAKN